MYHHRSQIIVLITRSYGEIVILAADLEQGQVKGWLLGVSAYCCRGY